MANRRTVRLVTVIVETVDLSEREHDRRVQWVEKNLQDSGRTIDQAFISMVFHDEEKKVRGIFAVGDTPTDEIKQIAREMVG